MSLILSIETSTKVCSIALHEKGKLLSFKESFFPNSHSELINVFIEDVVYDAKIEIDKLDAVCISEGPGSYTGLRIGTSTAKGLCYALDIPLISIKTLQGMALNSEQIQPANFKISTVLTPMIDARRMEVYCANFDEKANCLTETEAKIIDESSFSETLKHNMMLFFGDGAEKCKEKIKHENAIFLDDIHPTAKSFGEYAFGKYLNEEFEDLAYFEPFYLKEFHTIPSKKNLLKT